VRSARTGFNVYFDPKRVLLELARSERCAKRIEAAATLLGQAHRAGLEFDRERRRGELGVRVDSARNRQRPQRFDQALHLGAVDAWRAVRISVRAHAQRNADQ